MERREIGETFDLIEPARVPAVPIGVNRVLVKLIATLSGLTVGLLLVALVSLRAQRPVSPPAPVA
jgi:hypothetical protein